MRMLTDERKDRLRKVAGPVSARLSALWSTVSARLPETQFRERMATKMAARSKKSETPEPTMLITLMPRTSLVVTMASVTGAHYVSAGQMARLSTALSRYARHFDEVVFITPDKMSLDDELDAENVTHLRAHRMVPGPRMFRTVASVALRFRAMRRATAVVALDEAGAVPGWLVARLSGCELSLSAGAPWAPPKSKTPFDGLKAWPVRQALKRVSDVTLWEGEPERDGAENAESHMLPAFVDSDLYCPLVTTDPNRPRMVGAFLPASDTASAIGLIGAAEKLKKDGHNVMFRVFMLSGTDGEVQAAAMQGDVEERSAPIEFSALPRIEMLPDVISRLRMCLNFGPEEALPFTLRAMSSGVPCIAIGVNEDESAPRPRDWRDFVLKAGGSNEEIAHAIEALIREPGLRLRMAREGRRLVIAQHSLDAIASQEAAIFRHGPLDAEPESAEPEFDADAEAAKLSDMLAAIGVARDDEDERELEVAV